MTEVKEFQELLDATYEWPSEYLFKFIVPREQLSLAMNILVKAKVSQRESRSGKYISLTATMECESSVVVIEIYNKMAIVPGVVSL